MGTFERQQTDTPYTLLLESGASVPVDYRGLFGGQAQPQGVDQERIIDILIDRTLPAAAIQDPLVIGRILFQDGTVTAPSVSWNNERNTGRFRISAGDIGESVGGVLKFDWTASRINTTIPIYFDVGSAAAPSVTWTSSPTTGRFRVGPDNPGESVSASLKFDWNATRLSLVSGYLFRIGSADTTANISVDIINSINGDVAFQITNTNTGASALSLVQVASVDGTHAADVSHTSTTFSLGGGRSANEAIFSCGSASDSLAIVTGGAQPIRFVTNAVLRGRFLSGGGLEVSNLSATGVVFAGASGLLTTKIGDFVFDTATNRLTVTGQLRIGDVTDTTATGDVAFGIASGGGSTRMIWKQSAATITIRAYGDPTTPTHSTAHAGLYVSGGPVSLTLDEVGAAADNKVWRATVTSEQFLGSIVNDANNTSTNWIEVDRTGTTVDLVNFPNSDVQCGKNFLFKSGTANIGTLDHAITAARTWTLPDVTATLESQNNKDAASGYAGLNSVSRTTKGVDTTDDLIVDTSAKGLVLKDTQGSPHYWRVSVSTLGVLLTTDLGTTKP